MLYLDDAPQVEIGVQVPASAALPEGTSVVRSALPGGRVAEALHVGPASGLASTHAAVRAWCEAEGLALTGVRWEVYGDWGGDESTFETVVRWQLTP
jgi:effector-binding domain-containing protein